MTNKRFSIPSKERNRSLKQFVNMSDEEYDEYWATKMTGYESSKNFEIRINGWLEKFSEDYDLNDLKANDKLVLRALAQAHITLEDLESYSFDLRTGGIQEIDITKLERINNMMSVLRKDISSMQNDLKITRRVRKGDDEESVVDYIEKLKVKAKEFYEKRMFYVWCDKCSMLLFTGWFLYPDNNGNKIQLTCRHKLETGEECGNKVTINSKQLLENRGTNKVDIPEFFR